MRDVKYLKQRIKEYENSLPYLCVGKKMVENLIKKLTKQLHGLQKS